MSLRPTPLVLAAGVLAGALTSAAAPAGAAIASSISPQKVQPAGPTCGETLFRYGFFWTPDTDDGDGFDYIAVLSIDGDGSVVDHDIHRAEPGSEPILATGAAELDRRELVDNRKFEFRLVDLDSAPDLDSELDADVVAAARTSTLLATTTRDLGDYFDVCASLPHGGFDTFPIPPGSTLCDDIEPAPFTDIDPSGTHTANIACASHHQLVRGGPNGLPATSFGPTLTTSRAQLASLVWNLLQRAGVAPVAGAPGAFADDDGSAHEGSIDQLAALGVIGGNGEDGSQFFPGRAATRSEMASFMARSYDVAMGSPLQQGRDAFVDDDTDPAEADINALFAASVVSGKVSYLFDPTETVTREQIATFFVRLLGRMV